MKKKLIDPMSEATYWISYILDKYGIDTEDRESDIGQDIINCAVCIDNAYNGFDGEGNLVGVVEP